ncbi:hypothetical protein E4U41_001281 [Claviceps citrina]|nr:hypothetical protein E4U41_001281 [Claviceps citrina]
MATSAPRPRQPQPSPPRSNPGVVSNPRRFEESWVEVASQPSSSSLSSIGDEIVTTGLRVRGPPGGRRRRALPLRPTTTTTTTTTAAAAAIHPAGTSSQDSHDDCDESDGESDYDGKLLASSTEHGNNTSPQVAEHVSGAELDSDGGGGDDDDDDATALGRAPAGPPVFRPQPNAFSHPSVNRPRRSQSTTTTTTTTTTTSSMPPHPHSGFTRPSFSQRPQQTRVHRGGPTFMTPSIREDNDAALRASLTTLLSCAAAARGLPRSKDEADADTDAWRASRHGVRPSDQPMELRLLPESELMQPQPRRRRHPPSPSPSTSPAAGAATPSPADKSKRGASAPGRSPRASKKKKVLPATSTTSTTSTSTPPTATSTTSPSEDALLSPTLLTWVVSAGVVVLVSVVGFGAGYVIGREVGRQDARDALSATIGAANESSQSGRDVIRSSGGLRRLRWGAGAVSRGIAAQA